MIFPLTDKIPPRAACAAMLAASLALFPAASPAQARAGNIGQTDSISAQAGKITVEASGSATSKPDMASLQILVSQQAKTAQAAGEAVKKITLKLLPALKKQDIAEKDIQSNGLTVNSVYNYQDKKSKKEKLFEASTSLTVKVRNIAALGKVIDSALANGATGLGDAVWTNSDTNALYTEARQQAMRNAEAKIQTYAQAAGLKMGRILQIEELSDDRPSPRFYSMAKAAAPMASADMPIAEGEETYSARISLTAELIAK